MERTGIAIVGIGCRFPTASDGPEELWSFLLEGGDAVREVPPDRWAWKSYYDPDPAKPGKMATRSGSFLDQSCEAFDAAFFSVAPREAAELDPQQRLLLEVSWEAFEDSGANVWSLRGSRTGVFVGAFMLDNMLQRTEPHARDSIGPQTATTCTATVLASRLSYFYDLRGPSMAIDTACSSSLVAIHQGCESLRSGDCDLVLAGGVNRIFRPEAQILMSKGQFLAADGRSKAFSARADGYGRGEGCGLVVLKRVADALASGDKIYAVIEGSGVNQDGRTSGPAVPSVDSQRELVRTVLCRAQIDPASVAYVEAHGTGTPVGDPIEMAALGAAIGRAPGRKRPCVVGSVKAGIGHTEAAAGVAGLIKAALIAQRGIVPPQAWFDELNPDINTEELGLEIARERTALEAQDQGRRVVCVNSFGYGGTNAHAVLCEPPPIGREDDDTDDSERFFGPAVLLSGHTETAVREVALQYAGLLRERSQDHRVGPLLGRLAYRTPHEHRRAIVGAPDEWAQLLELSASGGQHPDILTGRAPGNESMEPVFVFSGMGPQWWGMGRGLVTGNAIFRQHVERCDRVFARLAGWSIARELTASEGHSRVARTEVAQPLNFVLQTGIAEVLGDLGVVAAAVVGHSVGEVAAAYVAGVLDLEDALTVVYHRSRLQATTAGSGGMLATQLGEADATEAIAPYAKSLSVAAVNSLKATTIAGSLDALGALERDLGARGELIRRLSVEVAYHSPAMDPIVTELRADLADLRPRDPALPLFSSVDGAYDNARWDADYWVANTRDTVRFAAAAGRVLESGHRSFVEIGPHPVLAMYLQTLAGSRSDAAVFPTLRRGRDDSQALTETVLRMWLAGATIDWRKAYGRPAPHNLPRYPWQREPHWLEPPDVRQLRIGETAGSDAMHSTTVSSVPDTTEVELSPTRLPWCRDHLVDGAPILPAVGFLEAVVSAARRRAGDELPVVIENLEIKRPLMLPEHEDPILRCTVTDDGHAVLASRWRDAADAWNVHATARIGRGRYGPPPNRPVESSVVVADSVDVAAMYERFKQLGLDYRESFRCVRAVRPNRGTVDVDIEIGDGATEGYTVHPALLDAALHGALMGALPDASGLYVPVRIGKTVVHDVLPARYTARATLLAADAAYLRADIDCYDDTGRCVLAIRDIELTAVTTSDESERWLDQRTYESHWSDGASGERSTGTDLDWVVIAGDAAVVRALRRRVACSPTTATSTVEVDNLALKRADAVLIDVSTCGPSGGPIQAEDCLDLVQRIVRLDRSVELVFATRDACAVLPEDTVAGWSQGWLAGFCRVAANEAAPLRIRMIDHDGDVASLADAAVFSSSNELAIRRGRRFHLETSRMRLGDRESAWGRVAAARPALDVPNYQLVGHRASGPRWVEALRRAPGPGEIELRVEAVGLNYKDVAKQLGLFPASAAAKTFVGSGLGMELSAVVERVGAEVTAVRAGERYCATVAGGAFRRYVTAPLRDLRLIRPLDNWTHAEGAATLVAFCTAHRALAELAGLGPGDVVLIHGATGAVGLAAMQVARHHGATVLATAGTEEKRALARQLGASATFESRTADFVEGVLTHTQGRGVDVALNTLAGDGLRANLEAVSDGGCVIDISKREILDRGNLPLQQFDRNLAFFSFDLDHLAKDAERFTTLADTVRELAREGHYRPTHVTSVPAVEVGHAFESVARAAHVGKLVIDMRATADLRCREDMDASRPIRSDRLYVVTGGTGGLGPHIAAWLVDNGARHVLLLSRSGQLNARGEELVSRLRKSGATVDVASVNVSDARAVSECLEGWRMSGRPIGGVVHAAGISHDRPLRETKAQDLHVVAHPKVAGALALHQATMDDHLDFFLLTSSVSALTGTGGQVAYATANAAMEAIAHWRRRQGLPAVALQLGPVADDGMAAQHETIARYIELLGYEPLPLSRVSAILSRAVAWNLPVLAVFDLDWSAWAVAEPRAATGERFERLLGEHRSSLTRSDGLRSRLAGLPPDVRDDEVMSLLCEALVTVSGVQADELDAETRLTSLGLDSLMLLELQTTLHHTMAVDLSILGLASARTIGQAARSIAEQIEADVVRALPTPATR